MNNCYWSMTRNCDCHRPDDHHPDDDDDDDAQQMSDDCYVADEDRDRSLPGMLELSWSIQQQQATNQLVHKCINLANCSVRQQQQVLKQDNKMHFQADEELPDDMSLLSSLSDPECCNAEDKFEMPLHQPAVESRVSHQLLEYNNDVRIPKIRLVFNLFLAGTAR